MLKSNEQLITDKPHIVALLRRLQLSRNLVTIKINNEPSLHNSIVVDVAADNVCFYLDFVASDTGHQKILPGKLLHIESRLDGIKISFDVVVMHKPEIVAALGYIMAFPDNLIYKQRRRHFRAQIETTDTLAISLPLAMQQLVNGYLVDISASGVCSRFEYTQANVLKTEQSFHEAKITLPDKQAITCDIALRSVRHFPDHGYSLVGAEFIRIPLQQQHHLERVVAQLDRIHRRNTEVPGTYP